MWVAVHVSGGGVLLPPSGDIMTRPQFYLEGHLPLLAEVRLVADQHHHDFSREELPLQVLQPLLSLAEGILTKERRTSDRSMGSLHQLSRDRNAGVHATLYRTCSGPIDRMTDSSPDPPILPHPACPMRRTSAPSPTSGGLGHREFVPPLTVRGGSAVPCRPGSGAPAWAPRGPSPPYSRSTCFPSCSPAHHLPAPTHPAGLSLLLPPRSARTFQPPPHP